jgi:hypothetical protein
VHLGSGKQHRVNKTLTVRVLRVIPTSAHTLKLQQRRVPLTATTPRDRLPTDLPRHGAPPKAGKPPPRPISGPQAALCKPGKATTTVHAAKRGGSAKPGKVAGSCVTAKRGGSAKSAKLQLPKLRLCTAPARQARRAAVASPMAVPPVSVGVAAATPTCGAAAQTASAAEDDDPGIGSAGATAGGDHADPAQVAAPQAFDTPPTRAEASSPVLPRAPDPDHRPRPRAQTREAGRGRGPSDTAAHGAPRRGSAPRHRFARTLHPWEPA